MKEINRGYGRHLLELLAAALAVLTVTAAPLLDIRILAREALAAPSEPSDTATGDELLSHVPASFRHDCEEAPLDFSDELRPGLTGAVFCMISSSRDPDRVAFFQYETKAAMTKAYRSFASDRLGHTDDCEKKEGESSWGINNQHKGIVACYTSDRKYRVVAWTHEDLKILSVASSKKLSFAKLTTWWEKAGPS
jgi:hypothetical protein